MRLSFQHIGLYGFSVGQINFTENGIEWRDRANLVKMFPKDNITYGNWTMYGPKGYLKFYLNDGKVVRFDGFSQSDKEKIVEYANTLGIVIENEQVLILNNKCFVILHMFLGWLRRSKFWRNLLRRKEIFHANNQRIEFI